MPDSQNPSLDPTPSGYQRTTGGKGYRWQAPTAEQLAELLPQYHIEEMVGLGGMGAVYKGMQKALERPVAIKILPADIDDEDGSYTKRFKNEAKIMANLDHPAIVPVYDFGETADGQYFFVMGYIDGSDVQKMVHDQGRLPPEHALAIAAHVCDALDYAHSHGVVHRDIKPSNVLINMDGAVKVADFGLAKVDDPGAGAQTKSGVTLGTPDYVAPEALTIGMKVDGRADLYAVGVMLYNMLTGNVPRGMFTMPSLMIPGIDPRFDKIIAKAMKYDPDDRYATAAEMRRDLDLIITTPMVQHGGPSSAAIPKQNKQPKPTGKPPSPVDTPTVPFSEVPKRKSRTPLFVSLGGAAVIITGVTVNRVGKQPENHQGNEGTPITEEKTEPTVQVNEPPGSASAKTASPSLAPQVTEPSATASMLSPAEIADWVFSRQGILTVETSDQPSTIRSSTEIPSGTFKIIEISLDKRPETHDLISDDELKQLGGMTDLTHLGLQGRKGFTGSFLATLASCQKLTSLNIADGSFTSEHIPSLVLLPNLTILRLSGGATAEAFAALLPLKHIHSISIHGPASLAVCQSLAKYPELNQLSIVNTVLTPEAFASLAELKGLEYLELRHLPAENPTLAPLASMSRLKSLHLYSASAPAAHLKGLELLTPLKFIRLHIRAVASDIPGFAKMISAALGVEKVVLYGENLTEKTSVDARDSLQQELPKVQVEFLK